MADPGAARPLPMRTDALSDNSRNDGFRQAMLKAALDTTPQLTDENYSVWKDKMSGLLELRGVLTTLESPITQLTTNENAELKLLLISKMDSVTHNNVINSENRNSAKEIWKSIKERFASSQSSNRARVFNDFLYLTFKEDAVDSFITNVRVMIKKMIDVGIDLPQDILAYLVLFKFPASLQLLKRQIMHSDKDLKVEFVCNHLTQFNNESKAETRETSSTDAALYAGKNEKFNKTMRGSKQSAGGNQKASRCTEGWHNPKQDVNHTSDACWHLHPDKAPDWWRESQEKWKTNKNKDQVNYYLSLVTLWINHGNSKSRIILDSGASAHIFNDERYFSHLEPCSHDVIKTGKQDATLPIKGTGEVTLRWNDRQIKLQNCLFVPDIVINLISSGCLDEKGCSVVAKDGRFKVMKTSQLVLQGSINDSLYSVDEPSGAGSENVSHATTTTKTIQEIHEQFGHASISRLGSFIPFSISREEISSFECRSCALAKITKKPFKGISTSASKPFEKIHLDLIGPIDPQSKENHRFILTLVDNYTGYLAGFPLVKKDDTCDVLINLLENENKRLGYFPSWICSDGGGEFVGNRLVGFLGSKNIRRLISEPYHPEHNGRAERANRTIVESMRATFESSNIKKNLWPELLKSCCLMLNQIPKKQETDSPWKKMHGKGLPSDFIHPVGTPSIVVNQRRIKGRKFHPKGEEGLLVGFDTTLLSYRVLMPSGHIVKSKHVQFLKKSYPISFKLSDYDSDELKIGDNSLHEDDQRRIEEIRPESLNYEGTNKTVEETQSEQFNESDDEIQNQLTSQTPSEPAQEIQSTRKLRDRSAIKPPERYGFHHYYEPRTIESAIRFN
ncbi:hypothetical protein VP01_322g3 [Puccinia sorghi]|uniref:Integrase catalytic domain-containing protein n=1 Tax=Puccinia sorghi TaxID=27349 RepID=A0A0L6UY68_9BASI|nr:hypothetical protein VP01_322g3 [Puccinia sorghi]